MTTFNISELLAIQSALQQQVCLAQMDLEDEECNDGPSDAALCGQVDCLQALAKVEAMIAGETNAVE